MTYQPPAVTRIETRVHGGTISEVHPPLNDDWSNLDKLRWHAAVVAHDTGLHIRVHDGAHTTTDPYGVERPVPGHFGIQVGAGSSAAFTYHEAWTYLNGVEAGAREQQAH